MDSRKNPEFIMKKGPIIAVIPARYASTRFPGKPLAPLHGKPLLQWVWEGATQSQLIDRVIVATDDDRILLAAKNFGAEVKKTKITHLSGTDRIAEVIASTEADWVINVQGDEPMIHGSLLDQWIERFDPNYGMTTVATPLPDPSDLQKSDVVKVSFEAQGRAIGFRRQVPVAEASHWRHQHVGLYAYTPATLQKFVSLPPSLGEQREKLEQLRALENGIAIQVIPLTFLSVGVDTPGDVSRAERALANRAATVSK